MDAGLITMLALVGYLAVDSVCDVFIARAKAREAEAQASTEAPAAVTEREAA